MINKEKIKILRFSPLLKQTIWGGNQIAKLKRLTDAPESIGESWELSGVQGNETFCSEEEGQSLNTLVEHYGARLVGRHGYEHYGTIFPLLVKFIDARQNLSIQVHPDDEMALRFGQQGKTEMWYLLDSDPAAFLYCGFRQSITRIQYIEMVQDGSICSALVRYSVKQDDVFFIPAGCVHAIGAGCLLAEIQQTSDATYRIYDYARCDRDGNLRQLHTQEAFGSIKFDRQFNSRIDYKTKENQGVELVSCPYFTTSVYNISHSAYICQSLLDSFVILIGLSGKFTLTTDSDTTLFRGYETLLIAAENKEIKIEGEGKILEVHI